MKSIHLCEMNIHKDQQPIVLLVNLLAGKVVDPYREKKYACPMMLRHFCKVLLNEKFSFKRTRPDKHSYTHCLIFEEAEY